MHKRQDCFSYPSANGVNTLHGYLLYPKSGIKPVGVLHLLHGMREHLGRYRELGAFMTDHGYVVVGCDMAGHGRSVKDGLFGCFGEKDGWCHLTADVHTLYQRVRKQFPSLPYFMLGHSMGSFLARHYAAEYKPRLSGLLLSGTLYFPPCLLSLAIGFVRMVIRATGNGCAKRKASFSVAWLLTRDKEMAAEYERDPLNKFSFTYTGYRDLFILLRIVSRRQWAKKMDAAIPLFLFSGSQDLLGLFGYGPKRVYRMLLQSGHTKVTLRLYPKGRHESLNEVNRSKVRQELLRWMSLHNTAAEAFGNIGAIGDDR